MACPVARRQRQSRIRRRNLFVDRAHSVVSDFSLHQPGEADAVVEICRRLDGIPLAIELGASRMASMTTSEVRAHQQPKPVIPPITAPPRLGVEKGSHLHKYITTDHRRSV